MSIARDAVKEAYRSKAWAAKVDKMSEDQVVAIYMRLKAQGIIEEKR
jgi:hypothetical protein